MDVVRVILIALRLLAEFLAFQALADKWIREAASDKSKKRKARALMLGVVLVLLLHFFVVLKR